MSELQDSYGSSKCLENIFFGLLVWKNEIISKLHLFTCILVISYSADDARCILCQILVSDSLLRKAFFR